MLKRNISKVVYIKKLNLCLVYYKKGSVEKMSPCPGLIDQARMEKILHIEN